MSHGPSDTDLLRAIAHGDRAAFASLYDRYAPGMYGVALRVTRDAADAEDVIAEAFAQAWREAARYSAERGSVAAWLVTMVRSRALDAVRRRGRQDRLEDRASAETAVDPVAMGSAPVRPDLATEADDRARRMREALATLPEAQREVLALAYYDGLSQAEIADRLTVPLGTVKTRTRLALAKLREALGALAPEESR